MDRAPRVWSNRPRPAGLVGGTLFVVGAVVLLVVGAVAVALAILLMALVGVVMGAERLLGLLVPAYRRRRRERYVAMPAGIVRMARFGTGGRGAVIEARSYERPPEVDRH